MTLRKSKTAYFILLWTRHNYVKQVICLYLQKLNTISNLTEIATTYYLKNIYVVVLSRAQ